VFFFRSFRSDWIGWVMIVMTRGGSAWLIYTLLQMTTRLLDGVCGVFFWDGKLDLILGVFVCCEVFGIWCIRKCYMHHLQLVKKLIAFVVSVFFFSSAVVIWDLSRKQNVCCHNQIFPSALAVICTLSDQMTVIEIREMAPASIVRNKLIPRNHTASFRDPHWSTNGTWKKPPWLG
jgi:hypothetical protein